MTSTQRSFRTRPQTRFLVLLLAFAVAACGSDKDPVDPGPLTMQKLAGTYLAADNFGAITFTTTENGETTDRLSEGATLEIELAANGTTTGHLFVPGADEDGRDLDADLVGSWTLKGDTIRFSHQADTFLRDMPFRVIDTKLEGDVTFSEARVQVVLVRR
jgi:hypothetical protein